jgi:hypothetical protein
VELPAPATAPAPVIERAAARQAQPARAAAPVEPPQSSVTQPGAVRSIGLRVGDGNGNKVDLRFDQRGGEVLLTVRTADRVLADRISAGYPELNQDLARAGWRAVSPAPPAIRELPSLIPPGQQGTEPAGANPAARAAVPAEAQAGGDAGSQAGRDSGARPDAEDLELESALRRMGRLENGNV